MASADLGGEALATTDEFFASAQSMLTPGPAVFVPGKYTERGKWMDGWESRRKRGPGHDFCLVRLGVAGEVLALDVQVTAFPLHTRLAHPNTLRQIARIAAFCRRERVRLVHAHDFYSDLVGLAAARLAGVPVITSRRDLGHWLTTAQRRALGVACRLSDRVLANARSVANLVFSPFGRAEVGWETYVPLIQKEIGAACPASSSGFAAALARWQAAHRLKAAGMMDAATFTAMKITTAARTSGQS